LWVRIEGEVNPQTQEAPVKILRLEEVTSFPTEWRELTPEEKKEALALARATFTAADLQRYTETDEGVPFDEFLAELEELQKEFDQRAP
jgi:hypothetical protein